MRSQPGSFMPVMGKERADLAAASALSLPGMLTWLGIQHHRNSVHMQTSPALQRQRQRGNDSDSAGFNDTNAGRTRPTAALMALNCWYNPIIVMTMMIIVPANWTVSQTAQRSSSSLLLITVDGAARCMTVGRSTNDAQHKRLTVSEWLTSIIQQTPYSPSLCRSLALMYSTNFCFLFISWHKLTPATRPTNHWCVINIHVYTAIRLQRRRLPLQRTNVYT